MQKYHVSIHDSQTGQTFRIEAPNDRYILDAAAAQGVQLPSSCRSGVCTTCAVRVREGRLRQPEALGLSTELKAQGYALLCVSYPQSDLIVETQDEDEVYLLQFGEAFGRGRVRPGLPLEED